MNYYAILKESNKGKGVKGNVRSSIESNTKLPNSDIPKKLGRF